MSDWSLENMREGKVLPVDKPLDWTSFDAVNKIKWTIKKEHKLKKFKVGHAGTLDPRATGLLLICIGRATKTIPNLMGQAKRYVATIKLGETTPSYDTETEPDQQFPTEHITEVSIKEALQQFIGDIQQVPPVFSALKKEGKRLYDLARAGKEVEVSARPITIHDIEFLSYQNEILTIDVKCGKGTYIRSLAYDIGQALNSGAYLLELRRTEIGDWKVDDALQVEDICAAIRENH